MQSEDNSKGNDALCEVYAFLLERRRLRLAQEAQSTARTQQQAQSLGEDGTEGREITDPKYGGMDITSELILEYVVTTDEIA